MKIAGLFGRRSLLKAVAAFGGVSALSGFTSGEDAGSGPGLSSAETRLADSPLNSNGKVTVERRGQIVLIGINRPNIQNRIDPEAFTALAKAYYEYDHDPSLRAAILFGHGEHFSRGIDVDAFERVAASGQQPAVNESGTVDPLAKKTRLTKPLVVAAHGDTWNMGHELCLAADIRVAAANTRFAQDENSHGRFPAGGSTVRFVREAGWGNAMRYMLTGDHWSAERALRMGVVQEIAATPEEALKLPSKSPPG